MASEEAPTGIPLLLAGVALLLAACTGADEPGQDPPPPADVAPDVEPTGDAAPAPDVAVDAKDVQAEDKPVVNPPCFMGHPCDDNDPCTTADKCVDDVCRGTPYQCSDGRECTDDVCDGIGGCEFPVRLGWCLVGAKCLPHGTVNSGSTCQRCDTDANKIGWTTMQELSSCEDGNPCTFGDYCDKKGECKKGLPATCDDENECTLDECSSLVGCINTPVSGPCDDGDKCTPESVCSGGVCHSVAPQCDDGNPCTADTCLPEVGCQHVLLEGACEDGNACTSGDVCKAGVCASGPPPSCDDDTECTEDKCDPVFGCYHELVLDPCCQGAVHMCDDGNPCTTDVCNPSGGCEHENNALPCEDGNPCTAGDKCQAGKCKSGPPNPCDDGNPCTSDSCHEASGCQHSPKLGSCNDGISCTTKDTCVDGVCVGDASACKCDPDFTTTAVKATSLLLGETGTPGDGLDVDGKASTCAPAGDCSGGIDNSLSPMASLANENVVKEMEAGHIVMLLELIGAKTDGTPFTVAIYSGKIANWSCDFQKPGCDYLVDDVSLDEDCEPLVKLDNAKIVGGKLTAGGPGYSFPMMVPLFGDVMLAVTLYNGAISADVQIQSGTVKKFEGLIGGAVPKKTFVTAIEYVPESQLPVPKATIVQLLDLLITEDIDTGPPAGPDAASIGFRVKAVSANLIGVD